MNAKTSTGIFCLLATFGCVAGEVAEIGDSAEHQTRSDELFGQVSSNHTHDFVQSTAWLNLPHWSCTGTLVAPDRILTAAHCLCENTGEGANRTPPTSSSSNLGTVRFANLNGSLPSGADSTWDVIDWRFLSNARVCGPWVTSSTTDAMFHAPWDVAVVSIAPNASGLPPFAPVRVWLADADAAWHTGRILAEIPNSNGETGWWLVGYGTNAPAPWGTPCLGCGERRAGPLSILTYRHIRCELNFFQTGLVRNDCFNENMFLMPSVQAGNTVEAAPGDSGGPLVVHVTNEVGPGTIGATIPVIAGVNSAWADSLNDRGRFAAVGKSIEFLWENIGLPYSRTVSQQVIDGTAIFALEDVRINDRAHVVRSTAPFTGAPVSANGAIRLGVEALVGAVRAKGRITLEDRSTTGRVISGSFVSVGNNVSVSTPPGGSAIVQAEPTLFEAFDLDVDYTAPNDTVFVNPLRSAPVPDLQLDAGVHGNVSVRANAELMLFPGLHIFQSLNLESNSTLRIVAGAPTWIYILTGGSVHLRGEVVANANLTFFGLPNATHVSIGNGWNGTLVAPVASVDASMIQNAELAGSFFARRFELHQGRWLRQVSFLHSWIPTCTSGFQDCF